VGLRGRMSRLEKHAGVLYRTLRLPDGQQIRYTDGEMLGAVSAAIHQEQHRLLPYVRRIATKEGMPGLIRALEESHAREQD
jgi:hypothetical protein